MIFRKVLRSLAGGHNLEAAGPSPLDLFGGQGRLVTIGH